MNIEQMCRRRKELGYSYRQLADLTRIPLGTIQKIFGGVTKSPRRETIKALERLLGDNEKGSDEELRTFLMPGYEKDRGELDLYDYYRIPDNMRAELIDGRFYEMEAQGLLEQMAAGLIGAQLIRQIEMKGLEWAALFASPSVRLNKDKWTVVEPDLIVVSARSKLQKKRIEGAPDFVLEVTSNATHKKDLVMKTYKYEEAGVHIYWILEPERRRLLTYDFSGKGELEIYEMDKDTEAVFELEGHVFRIDFGPVIAGISGLEDK